MDTNTQLKQARDARTAAAWTTGLVLLAGAAFGTITGNDNVAFVIFFGVGGLGIGWFVWLHERVEKLEVQQALEHRGTPEAGTDVQPRPVGPSSASDPTVVAAVIGLAGVLCTALIALAK